MKRIKGTLLFLFILSFVALASPVQSQYLPAKDGLLGPISWQLVGDPVTEILPEASILGDTRSFTVTKAMGLFDYAYFNRERFFTTMIWEVYEPEVPHAD